ncbi:MAG: hypothetical protein WDA08_06825 [Weeksellaceae bacterium]
MKKITSILLLIPILIFSQITDNQKEKIQIGERAKNLFMIDGESYRLKHSDEIFSNLEAIFKINKAKSNKKFASILTYTGILGMGGGATILFVVKKDRMFAEHDRRFGWIVAGVGAGMLLSSIPLWIGYHNNVKNAVDIENGKTEETNALLKLDIKNTGIGITYQF